jgi:hypothetical protein
MDDLLKYKKNNSRKGVVFSDYFTSTMQAHSFCAADEKLK